MEQNYYKWVGKDEFIPGIKAGDISEVDAKTKGIEEILKQSKKFEFIEIEQEESGDHGS